jgi:hypothetical protein
LTQSKFSASTLNPACFRFEVIISSVSNDSPVQSFVAFRVACLRPCSFLDEYGKAAQCMQEVMYWQ